MTDDDSSWVDEAKVKEVVEGLRKTQLESITVLCEDLLPAQDGCRKNCISNCLYLAPPGGPTPWLWDPEAHEQMLKRVGLCLRSIQHDCHLRFDMRLRYQHGGKRCNRLETSFGSARGWLTRSYPRQAYGHQSSISFLFQAENASFVNDTACAERELMYDVGLGGDDLNCRIPSSGIAAAQTVKGNILRSEGILEVNVTHLIHRLVNMGTIVAIRPQGKCVFVTQTIWERFSGKLAMNGALHLDSPADGDSAAATLQCAQGILIPILLFLFIFTPMRWRC